MASIWHRVDEKLAETKGAFPQDGAVGVWRVEYADLLREVDEQEKKDGKVGGGREVVEEVDDEAQFPASVYGTKEDTASPKKIIESFQARGIPGFRVASTRNESTIIVSLGLAGLTFEIQEALTTSDTTTSSSSSDGTTSTSNATSTNRSLPEWRVEARQNLPLSKSAGAGAGTGAGTGASRLENAIVSQLNSRARKWDLRFLLVRCPQTPFFPPTFEQKEEY